MDKWISASPSYDWTDESMRDSSMHRVRYTGAALWPLCSALPNHLPGQKS